MNKMDAQKQEIILLERRKRVGWHPESKKVNKVDAQKQENVLRGIKKASKKSIISKIR